MVGVTENANPGPLTSSSTLQFFLTTREGIAKSMWLMTQDAMPTHLFIKNVSDRRSGPRASLRRPTHTKKKGVWPKQIHKMYTVQ